MAYSSAHTVFTRQLLYIRAHFQLGFLPSKQEAARSFPHSFEYPLPLELSFPQHTDHSWASPTQKREQGGRGVWFRVMVAMTHLKGSPGRRPPLSRFQRPSHPLQKSLHVPAQDCVLSPSPIPRDALLWLYYCSLTTSWPPFHLSTDQASAQLWHGRLLP